MLKYVSIAVLLIAAAGISWSQITSRKSAKEITVNSDFDITSDTTAVMIESDMVTVQGGTFAMGGNKIHDGKPIHNVSISSFKIAKHETTQEIWQKVMGSNPSSHNLGSKPIVLIQFPCMDCPVDRISWDDVQVFIKKLNTLTGKNYRLPTEAEWEYAARGGRHSKNFEYSGSNDIKEVAWTSLDSGSNTHPVGQKKANELGLFDMSGNVYEWCEDWYDENYYEKSPANDPKCVTVGEYHVSRGGNWTNPPSASSVANRLTIKIGWRWIGFRLASSL